MLRIRCCSSCPSPGSASSFPTGFRATSTGIGAWFALAWAIFLVCLVGRYGRNYLGRKTIQWADRAIMRVPLLNKIYATVKQVNESFSSNKSSFKQVVVVAFPSPRSRSIGFVTGDQHGLGGEKLLSVFIPTTPNPTSGFLVLVPESDVLKLDMTVADGIKFIISLGAISPDWPPITSPPPSHPPSRRRRCPRRRWSRDEPEIAMNLARTTGLVLRTRPLTETSLIVQWLTRDFGRVATVAKGARRPKSPFRGQLDLFYLADLSFARSSRSALHTLREARLLECHAGLRSDLIYLQQASYCAVLIEQTAEPDAPMPSVFQTFAALLAQLPKNPARPQTIFAFEMKWLHELGLQPRLADSKLTPGSRLILERLPDMDWPEIFQLRLSDAQLAEIRLFLHGFILHHLERIPRGRSAALGLP